MDPTRRLLFWLRVPYAADVALGVIGGLFLLGGRDVGWWLLLFAAVRAVLGTVALFWLAPKLIGHRRDRRPPPSPPSSPPPTDSGSDSR